MKNRIVVTVTMGYMGALGLVSIGCVLASTLQYSYTQGAVTMSWGTNSSDLLVRLSAKATGWLGVSISLSETHVRSEMYVGRISSGSTTFANYFCDSQQQPRLSNVQRGTLQRAVQENGITTIEFSRPLVGIGDSQHYDLTDSTFRVGLAFESTEVGESLTDFPQHSNTYAMLVNFITGETTQVLGIDPGLFLVLVFLSLGGIYAVGHWSLVLYKLRRKLPDCKDPVKEMRMDERFAYLPKSSTGPVLNFFHRMTHSRFPILDAFSKDVMFLGVYIGVNIALALCAPLYGYNIMPALGHLIAGNTLLLLLQATRNSFLAWILQIPFDRAIQFHRWIGISLVPLSLAHGLVSMINDDILDSTGLAAMSIVILISFCSLSVFRRRFFDYFLIIHQLLFISFLIVGSLHSQIFFFYAIAGIVICILDRFCRIARISMPRKLLDVTKVPGDGVRVKFQVKQVGSSVLGQYAFLSFSPTGIANFHPFTLTNGPNEEVKEVFIKALGDATKKLLSTSIDDKVKFFVDLPYGRWPFNIARYPIVLLVSGGIGITPFIAALRHIYDYNSSRKSHHPHLTKIILVWNVKKVEEYKWFSDIIDYCIGKSKEEGYPELIVSVLSVSLTGLSCMFM